MFSNENSETGAQLVVAVDISFPGKHMAILKVTGLTPPPSSSEPTHTVHLFAASWLKAGGDYVETGSSRLLMGERPFNTSLRLHPSCTLHAVIKWMKE